MVIPRFVRQALAGEPITVYGDGTQSRAFAFVGDVVGGIMALMAEPRAEGRVFNLGSDREISIVELARLIVARAGSASEIRLIPFEEAYDENFEDLARRVPDVRRARELVGFGCQDGYSGDRRSGHRPRTEERAMSAVKKAAAGRKPARPAADAKAVKSDPEAGKRFWGVAAQRTAGDAQHRLLRRARRGAAAHGRRRIGTVRRLAESRPCGHARAPGHHSSQAGRPNRPRSLALRNRGRRGTLHPRPAQGGRAHEHRTFRV